MSFPSQVVWYGIVVLATLNAVVRPSVDIPITPYYLLSPLVGLLLFTQARWTIRWYFWLFGIASYGLLVGLFYGTPILMQLAQLLKYLQLTTFFLLLVWLIKIDPLAPKRLKKIVYTLGISVFVIAGIQAWTGLEIPTVANEESHHWLNTVFFTPNDLALFLCGLFCLILCSDFSLFRKIFFLAFIFLLNIRNDAKAAILASILMIGMYCLVHFCIRFRIRPIFGLLVLFIGSLLAIVMLGETAIVIGETEFQFWQLFSDPFDRILNLQPYDLGGSIFDRTDALIYSIKAFYSSWLIGLGPAGSVYTLSLPGSELRTAKSLHNAIAEFVVEFGPVALLVGSFLLRPYARALVHIRPSRYQIALMTFFGALPLMSVSQSSGYISNYAFWLTAFLMWYSHAWQDAGQSQTAGAANG